MNRNIESIKNIGASAEGSYVTVNLTGGTIQERKDFGETMRATFGALKNQIEMMFYGEGMNQNVTASYYQTMNDPNQCMEVQGRRFYPHTGVGRLQAYNELGNPSGGCFTLHTMG